MQIKSIGTGPLMVNTYYVMDENTKKGFLVDPGGYDKNLAANIASDNCEIEYIVLTHGHGDHIGGVEGFLNDFPRARVVAAELETPMLINPGANMSTMTLGKAVAIKTDIAVKDNDTLSVGSMELKFLLTPGHSPGSMCILVEKALFSGDTLFHGSIGRTDFPGGSFEQLRSGVHQKLFTLPDDTKVYPGHMDFTTIGFEKENNPFV